MQLEPPKKVEGSVIMKKAADKAVELIAEYKLSGKKHGVRKFAANVET
jgi:hypothetical protein